MVGVPADTSSAHSSVPAYGQTGTASSADIYDTPSQGGNAYSNAYGSATNSRNAYTSTASSGNGSAYSSAYGSGSAYGNTYGSGSAYGSARAVNPTDAELEAEYGTGSAASRPPADPYGPYGSSNAPLDPEEEEIQQIKMEIRGTKNESLSSTRNALRLARETEETATNTMYKLGEQSDKIGTTERHLDVAKAHVSRTEDNARRIAQLNMSIFRPKWGRNRRQKREAEEARAIQRHIDERIEREQTLEEVMNSQRRVNETMGDGPFAKLRNKIQGPDKELLDPKAQRSRYQFEATQSDDELEDEIDQNLNDIGDLAARLNHLGRAMGEEVDEQNRRLQRISEKTSALDTRIYAGTQRLNALK
ncbi:Protein transport protein S9 plasma membrane t-SNARE [Malassezia cuniculi]|uniref:Protein transport protein S9 plasma membrane t-SNARE n=1 Tax=Malassezia cuniculi TaxID=948313 RepID=A0AAF0ET25_9BASI|nr:Protein transport protein S9 plasma membrane t-SNARE [Malassezia cuniculi]